jgi:predicted neuraminidase
MAGDTFAETQAANPLPVRRQPPSTLTLPVLKLQPSPKYWERNRMFQGIPTIERTKGGRLWASWYAGPLTEGNEGTFIVLVTSGDDGKTWSRPVAVCDDTTFFDGKTWDPRLWIGPDGSLWLSTTRTLQGTPEGRATTSWSFRAKNPEDPNTEWEEAVFNGYGVSLNKPTVLKGGAVLQPIEDPAERDNLAWMISREGGHRFLPHATIATLADGRSRRHCEHMLVERTDGSLWMLARTEYGIAQAESVDLGKTWSGYRPFTDRFGVNTRFHLRKLKSGALLLIVNDHPKARNTMTAMLSADDGRTWPYKLVLDERAAVSYPDATETDEGLVYVIYDRGRYNLGEQEILFARITAEDIKAGRITGAHSSLKNSINQLAPYGGGVKRNFESREYEKQYDALKLEIAAGKNR